MRLALKYGCNPHQAHASAETAGALRVLAGRPSMTNMLDALNGWQLARELKGALALPAAASFKHVSPAGAAVGVPLPQDLRRAYEVGEQPLTPLATAYARARGADAKCSFGDFVALSDPVDAATAGYLKGVVSDGVIAPGFDEGAFAPLAAKKNGTFIVMEANADYEPPAQERREIFGVALAQQRNDHRITHADLQQTVCGELTEQARADLLLGLVTLKYTQSNSMVYAWHGQTIGVGAGQQSRVDCAKLAGAKADVWHLGRHPNVLGLRFRAEVRRQQRINWRVRYIEGDMTNAEQAAFALALAEPAAPLPAAERERWLAGLTDVALASDGFIPFRDNIDHAQRHGVRFVAQPGGSTADADVAAACREYGIAMAYTGVRLFHH